MGDERTRRIDDAVKSLVEVLVPSDPNDDDDAADSRIHSATETFRGTLDSWGTSTSPPDVNNAQDLIKRKLLRENASPEKAAKFGNLYSRLLSLPVLSQKWSILYLLYKLSENEEGGPRSPVLESNQLEDILLKEKARRKKATKGSAAKVNGDESPARDPVQFKGRTDSTLDKRKTMVDGNATASDDVATQKSYAIDPPESAILRDLPFNLQGLSSANFDFVSPTSVKLPTTLPVPMISLLHTLAEPCLLYRGLSDFCQGSDGGLVGQSLRAAIGDELRSYLGLVATLEGEIRRALAAMEKGEEGNGFRKAGVTLKRCVIWTREATMGLRLMSLMVEESKEKRGGQLISMIHGFSSSHGDPFVGAFAERLLPHVTRPFYSMLRRWIYDGELSDPYNEFFVIEPSEKPDVDPRRVAMSVWQDKYKLHAPMVPSIMTQDFAKKIFLIGKSLNFIRYGCGEADWVDAYSKTASKELRYGDTATLETSIDEAYKTTMTRLIHLMDTKFHLFNHLHAIKKYLLLGQGDFIALLMESLAPNLDRPANSQYRHTLTSQLEHAIRNSNAQHDSADVLRRLDARMLELSSGEIGWDCFTLEYKIDAPCDVIITQWASTQYLKVFNLLWRVKRVEFALGSTWRRCMTGARGVLGSVSDKVGSDWKHARCVIAEMVHFVNQLQYYILFEVIEASWDALQDAFSKPGCTLDDLIEAHNRYINSITHKGLLGSSRSATTGQREDSFLSQLHYILKTMLAYKDVVDGLYSFSVAEFTRRQEFSAKVETRTAQGKWGITERDLLPADSSRSSTSSLMGRPKSSLASNKPLFSDGADSPFASAGGVTATEDHMLPSLRQRLTSLSADFKSRLNVLLYDLAHQPDVDMRFLGVVMNFNDVYAPINKRRKERERHRVETLKRVNAEKEDSDAGGSTVAGA